MYKDTQDFSKLICGKVYGTNSGTIYKKCCSADTLNWDIGKSRYFGRQGAPLHAEKCDKRGNSVWFLSYCIWEKRGIKSSHNFEHTNEVVGNGEEIIEKASEHGFATDKVRITFVKTRYGYEFLGVYELVTNGLTRLFKRLNSVYPNK